MPEKGGGYLLRGKVVQPDGTAPDRFLWVEEGRVRDIRRSRPPGSEDVPVIRAGDEDWIFPGLLDLHTHAKYNVLPIWEPDNAPFDNRFQWRHDDQYQREVAQMVSYLTRPTGAEGKVSAEDQAHIETLTTFAEAQAVAGGSTTLQESLSLEDIQGDLDSVVLCRSTGDPEDLGLPCEGEIFSPIDLFRPDENGNPRRLDSVLEDYVEARDAGKLYGTLAHLAEGKSGFGSPGGMDPYCRKEFEAFMADPAFADAEKVASSPFVIIHGNGIDTQNPAHIEFLLERNISIIWSPVSNLLLYGQTLDVEALVHAGINISLGTDWTPSGTKHLWDEAKFAYFFTQAIGAHISNVELFRMATMNPARALGFQDLGNLLPGAHADFFILRSPIETDDPLEAFFKTDDRHVRSVIINGMPRYGDRRLLKKFGYPIQSLPYEESRAIPGKAIHLPANLRNKKGEQLELRRDIRDIQKMMAHPPAPLEPTRRTMMLSMADEPYLRRLADLRKYVVDYGYEIRKQRAD